MENQNLKKITIEMACSINGIIAEEDGSEDFLSERGWEIMLELLEKYDVLIWGRKTWDNILSWGDDYINDLKDINIIVLSNKAIDNLKESTKRYDNVNYCTSVKDCLKLCNKLGYNKLFISGGAKINTAFMKENIVDEIILNYNPFVLNRGIQLFDENNFFKNKLKLKKVINEKDDIVQIHYKVLKNEKSKKI